MRQATSVLITPGDTFAIGDGFGGAPDCVQFLTPEGDPLISIRFLDVESIDQLASVLSALSFDTRLRAVTAVPDWHASEGANQ